jgi:hypothetical protein
MRPTVLLWLQALIGVFDVWSVIARCQAQEIIHIKIKVGIG